jgi:hypothetical protein
MGVVCKDEDVKLEPEETCEGNPVDASDTVRLRRA